MTNQHQDEYLRPMGVGMPRPKTDFHSKYKIDPSTGCWNWLCFIDKLGYGSVMVGRKQKRAHRYSYELLKGPVSRSMVMDHLCRNRACVNPDHLEAVSQKTNVMRGDGLCKKNAIKTHCDWGHEFTHENTYVHKTTGSRVCRMCRSTHNANRKKKL